MYTHYEFLLGWSQANQIVFKILILIIQYSSFKVTQDLYINSFAFQDLWLFISNDWLPFPLPSSLLTQACQEYEFEEDGEPRWQVFDMKAFE